MNQHLQQQLATRSSQSGFTIIESLLALLVVAALLVAISPILVLATANRVQAKRVELATNAAKAYIDGVRSGTIPPPPINDASRPLNNIGAPNSAILVCRQANNYCGAPGGAAVGYQMFCVDGDGDGKCTPDQFKDMLVQAVAYQANTNTTTNRPDKDKSFQLGIRVYRADAFLDSGSLKASASRFIRGTRKSTSIVTGGLGDRKAPQIELQTEIVPAANKPNYTDYCTRLGGCS